MADYNITSYGVFSSAIATTNTFSGKVQQAQEAANQAKTILSDGGVFMGPVQEHCMTVFQTLGSELSGIVSAMSTLSSYLNSTDQNYKTGDEAASNTITSIGNTTSVSSANALASGNVTSYTYDGKNFNIVNTKTSVTDYQQYVKNNGLYQNAGLLGGECMVLSQYYAKDMLTGKNTSKNTMANTGGSPATRINEKALSDNEQDVLDYAYKEINEGHPVVLQVTQRNPHARHLVTMVGYDSSVQSSKDLTPDKILVLDCVDGEIQTLDKRNRSLKKTTQYQAIGPTDSFLQREVA